MPHFVIDCPNHILTQKPAQEILQNVFDAANSSGLFDPADIKVRINLYEHYTVNDKKSDFIHVFANIMEGRNAEQKADLSKSIVEQLASLFPEAPLVSMNIRDFEKASYYRISR